jgi:hypothetical protein
MYINKEVALIGPGNATEDIDIDQDDVISTYEFDGETIKLPAGTPMVYVSSDALDPAIFHSDNTREYMAKAKRYNPDNTLEKETILLVCNTNGEILLEYGESAEKGELLDVYLMDKKLMCVYENNDGYTLYYTPLPLNTTGFKDEFYMGSDFQSAKKIVSNGQFYILLQEGVYNATGARLQ